MPKAKKAVNASKILNKDAMQFLENYVNNASPVGFEAEGQKMWLQYIEPFIDDKITDAYGSCVGVVNPEHPFKVVIEAHADEIGWFVNYIHEKGYIYVRRNGGADQQIAPSLRANIHGKKGVVKAVFGWPAIHTRKGDNKETNPKIENIWLDTGATSRKEVQDLGIHIGSPITYQDKFDLLNNKFMVGRALDNRIGGFMIAQVARMLCENKKKLPFGLYIVNAVQEEIGLRGAEMIARKIKPNIAIITDVTHDTQTPLISRQQHGDIACGKGPTLTYGPAVQTKLLSFIEETASKNKIPAQLQAASSSTGTDTDSFAYANDGCPSALISLPLRYMHTTVEMVHQDDVENTIKLIYETLLKITPSLNLSYF